MKTKGLRFALGLSLLFNLSALVGMMQSRSASSAVESTAAGSTDKFFNRVKDELKLDESQAQMFGELRQRHEKQSAVFDESIAVVRQTMAAELRKDSPDVEQLQTLVDQEIDLNRQRREAGADLYGRFLVVLSPEQRREMGGRMFGGPRAPHKGPPPLGGGAGQPQMTLKRFDANNNGVLDPDELQNAQRALDERRNEMMKDFPRRRFDPNRERRGEERDRRAPGDPPRPPAPGPATQRDQRPAPHEQ